MPQSDTKPTRSQLSYLEDLQSRTGRRFLRPPATRAEASKRIRSLQSGPRTARPSAANPEATPTQAQLDYIAKLSRSRGLRFGAPRTQAAAAQQIAALMAVPTGRYQRLIERDLRTRQPTAPAAAVRDHEVEGYGANCQWSHQMQGE